MNSIQISIPSQNLPDRSNLNIILNFNSNKGMTLSTWAQLNDLDFADDLALNPHTKAQMQEKMNTVAETSAQIGININIAKSKIFRASTPSNDTVNIEGKEIEEEDNFTYLGSIVYQQGGTEADIKAKIG